MKVSDLADRRRQIEESLLRSEAEREHFFRAHPSLMDQSQEISSGSEFSTEEKNFNHRAQKFNNGGIKMEEGEHVQEQIEQKLDLDSSSELEYSQSNQHQMYAKGGSTAWRRGVPNNASSIEEFSFQNNIGMESSNIKTSNIFSNLKENQSVHLSHPFFPTQYSQEDYQRLEGRNLSQVLPDFPMKENALPRIEEERVSQQNFFAQRNSPTNTNFGMNSQTHGVSYSKQVSQRQQGWLINQSLSSQRQNIPITRSDILSPNQVDYSSELSMHYHSRDNEAAGYHTILQTETNSNKLNTLSSNTGRENAFFRINKVNHKVEIPFDIKDKYQKIYELSLSPNRSLAASVLSRQTSPYSQYMQQLQDEKQLQNQKQQDSNQHGRDKSPLRMTDQFELYRSRYQDVLDTHQKKYHPFSIPQVNPNLKNSKGVENLPTNWNQEQIQLDHLSQVYNSYRFANASDSDSSSSSDESIHSESINSSSLANSMKKQIESALTKQKQSQQQKQSEKNQYLQSLQSQKSINSNLQAVNCLEEDMNMMNTQEINKSLSPSQNILRDIQGISIDSHQRQPTSPSRQGLSPARQEQMQQVHSQVTSPSRQAPSMTLGVNSPPRPILDISRQTANASRNKIQNVSNSINAFKHSLNDSRRTNPNEVQLSRGGDGCTSYAKEEVERVNQDERMDSYEEHKNGEAYEALGLSQFMREDGREADLMQHEQEDEQKNIIGENYQFKSDDYHRIALSLYQEIQNESENNYGEQIREEFQCLLERIFSVMQSIQTQSNQDKDMIIVKIIDEIISVLRNFMEIMKIQLQDGDQQNFDRIINILQMLTEQDCQLQNLRDQYQPEIVKHDLSSQNQQVENQLRSKRPSNISNNDLSQNKTINSKVKASSMHNTSQNINNKNDISQNQVSWYDDVSSHRIPKNNVSQNTDILLNELHQNEPISNVDISSQPIGIEKGEEQNSFQESCFNLNQFMERNSNQEAQFIDAEEASQQIYFQSNPASEPTQQANLSQLNQNDLSYDRLSREMNEYNSIQQQQKRIHNYQEENNENFENESEPSEVGGKTANKSNGDQPITLNNEINSQQIRPIVSKKCKSCIEEPEKKVQQYSFDQGRQQRLRIGDKNLGPADREETIAHLKKDQKKEPVLQDEEELNYYDLIAMMEKNVEKTNPNQSPVQKIIAAQYEEPQYPLHIEQISVDEHTNSEKPGQNDELEKQIQEIRRKATLKRDIEEMLREKSEVMDKFRYRLQMRLKQEGKEGEEVDLSFQSEMNYEESLRDSAFYQGQGNYERRRESEAKSDKSAPILKENKQMNRGESQQLDRTLQSKLRNDLVLDMENFRRSQVFSAISNRRFKEMALRYFSVRNSIGLREMVRCIRVMTQAKMMYQEKEQQKKQNSFNILKWYCTYSKVKNSNSGKAQKNMQDLENELKSRVFYSLKRISTTHRKWIAAVRENMEQKKLYNILKEWRHYLIQKTMKRQADLYYKQVLFKKFQEQVHLSRHSESARALTHYSDKVMTKCFALFKKVTSQERSLRITLSRKNKKRNAQLLATTFREWRIFSSNKKQEKSSYIPIQICIRDTISKQKMLPNQTLQEYKRMPIILNKTVKVSLPNESPTKTQQYTPQN